MQKYKLLLSAFLGLLASGSAITDPNRIPAVYELASPAYEGRGVGTEGLAKARDYIIKQLEEAGLQPAFAVSGEGDTPGTFRYTQELRVFIGNDIAGDVSFLDSKASEFVPLAFSKSGRVADAEIVFVGFGISVRQGGESPYDDYAGLDVKGKIVVALMGDPGTGNRDSIFRDPAFYHYSSAMYKVQNAEVHGAAGIVLVRDPLSLSGAEPALRFQDRQGGGATSEIVAGQASIQFAEKALGLDLKVLQEKIAATQKPQSANLGKVGSLAVTLKRRLGAVENVAAFIPGTDPALANEYIVIGAHYDHLGYGGDHSMDPDGAGKIHFGADDNASGVQAVLDIARAVRSEGGNRRPLIVAFFTAEEVGLLGSKQFAENLPLPESAKAVAMINLDMVGRMQDNKLSVLALRSGKEFDSIVESVNEEFKLGISKGDSGFGSSDHASFLTLKIPALFFTTGSHLDYHRPSDTAEKINVDGLATVVRFALATFRKIDANVVPPTYDPASEDTLRPPREGRGYGVYFGSIPDFNQADGEGVLLSGTRPGSPADLAGLKAGDLLTAMGEVRIKNLHDLVFALRFFRANEEVTVEWRRDGQDFKASTVLRNREVH